MEIIYIANARIPTEKPHGKQIMKTCEALAASGVSLELWIPSRKQLKILRGKEPFDYYGIGNKFTIRKFPCLDFLILANNLPSFVQPLFFWLEEFTFLLSLLFLSKPSGIIYSRSISVCLVFKLFRGSLTYYEAHNVSQNILLQKIYSILLSKINGLVVISHGLVEVYKRLGMKNILVASDAVDIKEFRGLIKEKARKRLRLDRAKKYAIYTGSLAKEKGMGTVLQVANIIPSISFLIVGGNFSDKNIWQDYSKNIKFEGFVNPKFIPLYLKAADVLILPSDPSSTVSRDYTSPMKLFEYLASGTPIVAADTPANKEILNNGNCILIPSGNIKEYKKAIEKILADIIFQEKLSKNALETACKNTWLIRAQKIIKFLSSE